MRMTIHQLKGLFALVEIPGVLGTGPYWCRKLLKALILKDSHKNSDFGLLALSEHQTHVFGWFQEDVLAVPESYVRLI
jgi:hypothetical protein